MRNDRPMHSHNGLSRISAYAQATKCGRDRLVFNSHPHLKPTAKGGKFNAEVTWVRSACREPTSQAVDVTGANRNLKAFDKLLSTPKANRSGVSVTMANSKKRLPDEED
jgi:hypothetical protein